jgi:UPF0755 protein
MVRTALYLGLCLLLLTGVGAHAIWSWWRQPVHGEPGKVITVAQGSSLSAISRELARVELLTWPRLWTLVARLKGQDARIKQGEYNFDAGVSPEGLLKALVEGRVINYSVTLPEGITLSEALDILQSQEPLEPTLEGSDDPRLLALAEPYPAVEGLFFPDTYQYVRGDTDLDILELAGSRMRQELNRAWNERDVGLPYKDVYELLIMASIVEKETGVPEERSQIAGVFVRRLLKGMRLQTDPTVIYGLGISFDGNLRRRHLEDAANEFNTYRHGGLPPTPIALPGAAAIQAAVHPADGSALYFVARGDGSHAFSDTLEQHTAAVRQYQLQRRQDYRSAPLAVEQQP